MRRGGAGQLFQGSETQALSPYQSHRSPSAGLAAFEAGGTEREAGKAAVAGTERVRAAAAANCTTWGTGIAGHEDPDFERGSGRGESGPDGSDTM
eukprot:scaffold17342_cov130-Isochrysis_galbana.AAC.15